MTANTIYNNNCPTYLKDNFRKVDEHHGYNTSLYQFNLVVPKIKWVDSSSFHFHFIID